jgi:hypothetical protein
VHDERVFLQGNPMSSNATQSNNMCLTWQYSIQGTISAVVRCMLCRSRHLIVGVGPCCYAQPSDRHFCLAMVVAALALAALGHYVTELRVSACYMLGHLKHFELLFTCQPDGCLACTIVMCY